VHAALFPTEETHVHLVSALLRGIASERAASQFYLKMDHASSPLA
jgi:hypothetical protein